MLQNKNSEDDIGNLQIYQYKYSSWPAQGSILDFAYLHTGGPKNMLFIPNSPFYPKFSGSFSNSAVIC